MKALILFQVWQQVAGAPQTLEDQFRQLQGKVIGAIPGIITGLIVLLIFWVVASKGHRLIARAAPRVKADANVALLLSRIYYYSVMIFGIITALQTSGVNVTTLVAGLGLTGFALGFALKDVLSNLMAGMMLLFYRPFQIGDQIVMGTYEGTIEMIRMRDTVLRSYDGRLIIIPNTKLITEVVVNNMAARLVRESIEARVAPGTSIDVARETLRGALTQIPALAGRVEPVVAARELADRATQLEGHFWFDPRRTDRLTIRDEAARAIKQAFDAAGIQAVVSTAQTAPPLPEDKKLEPEAEMEERIKAEG